MRSLAFKRAMDLVLACVAVVLLSPLLVAVSIAVLGSSGRPIFFRQDRAGRDGKIFSLLKFRTMSDERDAQGRPLPDEARITGVGAFLRMTTLDELPELFNVIRGDMSLVGPRPLLVKYLPLYSREQARRHDVKPGLTGWAVLHGRNAIGWDERFALDVWYVDHWTNGLDLQIILRTVGLILRREGVSASGHTTMPEFRGRGQA